jgi:acetyl esterase/lipase
MLIRQPDVSISSTPSSTVMLNLFQDLKDKAVVGSSTFFFYSFISIFAQKLFIMLKKLSLVLALLLSASTIFSQNRYQESAFDEIITETYTYSTKDGENLDLDIYMPDYDAELKRATIIYVHGGGFSAGARDMQSVKNFCNHLAGYGYVVASVSYRLTRKDKPKGFGCNCPATDKLNTFYAAVEDVQDATFFLIEHREQFAIDPQKIILAGSSAGAETVLNTAYQPPYCYGLDSGPVAYAGVISMAGAIPDTTVIYDESAVPSLLFHGTEDKLVPYGTAPHHYCKKSDPGYLILHGSLTISKKLRKLDIPCWLHITCGGGHEIATDAMTKYFDTIIDFGYYFIIKERGNFRQTIIKKDDTVISSDNASMQNPCLLKNETLDSK